MGLPELKGFGHTHVVESPDAISASPLTISFVAKAYGIDSKLAAETAWIMPRVNHLTTSATRPIPMVFPDFRTLKMFTPQLQNLTVTMRRDPEVNRAYDEFMKNLHRTGDTAESFILHQYLTYTYPTGERFLLPFAVVRDNFPRRLPPNVVQYTAWFTDNETGFADATMAVACFLKAQNLRAQDVVIVEKPTLSERPAYGTEQFVSGFTPSVGLKHMRIYAHQPAASSPSGSR